jgi:hypothetical protein
MVRGEATFEAVCTICDIHAHPHMPTHGYYMLQTQTPLHPHLSICH